MSEVTLILDRAEQGDAGAAEELLPLVYEELRRLAAAKLARERPGQTLQPTALVHEAWLRLCGSEGQPWRGREHFVAAAAESMRRILVDRARRRQRLRHGGGQQRFDLDSIDLPIAADDEKCLAVHECLDQLEREDPDKARVVKLRVFVGLKAPEIAAVLGCSERTVGRHWDFALAWLSRALKGN